MNVQAGLRLCCSLPPQWLSGRVLDSRPRGRGFEPHQRHCVVSLSKNINPSLVLVQPRKTRPFITERLLMGHKESNQTKQIPPPPPKTGSLVLRPIWTLISENLTLLYANNKGTGQTALSDQCLCYSLRNIVVNLAPIKGEFQICPHMDFDNILVCRIPIL